MQENKVANNDIKEFIDVLKYELKLDNINTETIKNTMQYLEKRGFYIYRDHNV